MLDRTEPLTEASQCTTLHNLANLKWRSSRLIKPIGCRQKFEQDINVNCLEVRLEQFVKFSASKRLEYFTVLLQV